MEAPDPVMAEIGGADERHPHERRHPEIEALLPIGTEVGIEPRGELDFGEPAPIHKGDGNLDRLPHLLQRLRESLPEEARAQGRMAAHRLLPGGTKGGDFELAMDL